MSKPVVSWRRRVNDWVHSSQVQNVIMAVIILNSITIGMETAVVHSSTAYQVLHLLDLLALGVFIVEIVDMSNLTPSDQEGDANLQEPPAHEATNAAILAEVHALCAGLQEAQGAGAKA